jgi:terminal uridylyltransferase
MMANKKCGTTSETAANNGISSGIDDLPSYVRDMLGHASAQLLSQRQPTIASNCGKSQLEHFEHPVKGLDIARMPSTNCHGESFSNGHRQGTTRNIYAEVHLASNQPAYAIKHSSNPADPGYSYSHAPRTRFGDQQSDPYRRAQIQINYLDALATRVPPFGSLVDELRSKESLRKLLTTLAREALERYAKQRGYTIDDESIDLKCFGSLRNGFALPGADLDLVLTTHAAIFPKELEAECPRILNRVFLDAGFGARRTQKTRVPIIKLCEKPSEELLNALRMEDEEWEVNRIWEASEPRSNGHPQASYSSSVCHRPKRTGNMEFPASVGIQCDINFSGRLALYNTELLRSYALL